MKITLPGTGANECIPAFRCKCRVCEHARQNGGNNIRLNSALFIENNDGSNLLVDMPPQIISLLRNSKIDDTLIKNVLFTHRHEDHILGARYLFQGVPEKGFEQYGKVDLYMPKSAYWSMSGKFLFNKSAIRLNTRTNDYKINFVLAYKSFLISGMKITALETNHLKEKGSGKEDETFGYLIQTTDGITVVYLLDAAKELPDRTLEILITKKIDLLIADCTFTKTRKYTGHSDIEGAIELKKIVNPDKMIISHIGHQNMNHFDLELVMDKQDIIVGYDGMKILI
jgi:phosphoribosyl 1,2-cyclic phosphate phosphodiesterase